MFVKLFNEMNEKAQESMSSSRDEPETALEYLKKVHDTLEKIESSAIVTANNDNHASSSARR